ncbi:MAG: hypothetical protein MI806_27520, partial [Minwuiales bacterium]|nr:hypothetical protein [Minwuiales bacterium]
MSGGRVRSNYWGIQARRKARRVKQEHAETAPGTVQAGLRHTHRTRPLAALALAAALTIPLSLSTGTAATKAGVTPGALGVDESGQATYSIPIAVPPGIAGMEPSLSLNFNSGAGNGLLGVGWSIGGLSVIHRCPQTFAQDGVVGQVGYGTKDRFCLDGKRLINVSGGYGADGTEYRTEIDSFAKIISHGAAVTGPDYFTVRTKSGQYIEYGRTTDSRIEAVGSAAVRVWAVNKIRDSVGNYMNFGYAEDTTKGGYRIAGIDYTVNDAAGVAHTNSVNFLYQARPDVARGYLGGSLITTDKRLATIRTVTGGATVREYRLAYETGPDTSRSRLTSVTECDGAGDCLKPTAFTWRTAGGGYQRKAFRDLPHPIRENAQTHATFADVDGDGVDDFVRAFRSDGANNFQDIWLSTTSGWTHSPGRKPPFLIANHNIGFPSLGEFVDVNGDGLVDWVESYSRLTGSGVVTERNAWKSTGTGWSLSAGYLPPFKIFNYEYKTYEGAILKEGQFLDVNGDGRADWVRAIKISVVDTLDGATTQTDHDLRTTWLNTGSGWATNTQRRPPFVISEEIVTENCFTEYFPGGASSVICGARQHESKPRGEFVDANGDGLADFVQAYKDGSTTHRTTWMNVDGSFWSVSPGRQAPFTIYDGDFKRGEFIDVNGDGLADWVQSYTKGGTTNKTTWLSTGKGWIVSAAHQVPFIIHDDTTGPRGTFADVNGDGLPDWVEAYKYNGTEHRTTWINTGNGWSASTTHKIPFVLFENGFARGEFVDTDGDGIADPVRSYSTGGGNHFRETWRTNAAGTDRLETVEDGLGRTSALFYAPLTNDDYYTKLSEAVFPVQETMAPIYVVYRISRDDGVGGQAVTNYTYEGARVHAQGRGFMGFRFIDAEDVQTGIVTTTKYRQAFPFSGQVQATESYLPNGTTLKKVDNTFASLPLNGGKTVFPYVSQSVARSYELNDGPGNFSVTTVTTDSTYDSWGNPTQVVVTTTGGGETFTTTTNNTYTNNPVPGKWHLGRLT